MDALSKIKKIETLIKSLKKEGYNVFVVDNERLVFENKTLSVKNSEQSFKEVSKSEIGYGGSRHYFSDLNYDYEIQII